MPAARRYTIIGCERIFTLRRCVVPLFIAFVVIAFNVSPSQAGFVYNSQYGGSGTGNGQFDTPRGLASYQTDILVIDTGNNRVQKFAPGGEYLYQWGSLGLNDPSQFNGPSGIATNSSGDVYVVDSGNNRIQKFNSSGEFERMWGDGVNTGVAGSLQTCYSITIPCYRGWPASPSGGFNNPNAVAIDPSGSVFVVDTNNNAVQKFTSGGTYNLHWGWNGTGDGQFDNPNGIAVDGSGNVYVADSDNNRVQKFSDTGDFFAKWGSPGSGEGQFNDPRGIAVDGSGNVYVADSGNNRVQQFSSNGAFQTEWGSGGSGSGQLNSPGDISIDSSGAVYVADTGNNRVQKFTWCDSCTTEEPSPQPGPGQPPGTPPATSPPAATPAASFTTPVNRKKLKRALYFRGTYENGAQKVEVAVQQLVRKRSKKRPGKASVRRACRVLKSAARNKRRFSRSGSCALSKLKWQRAKIKDGKWGLRLKHGLPLGSYIAYVRACNSSGDCNTNYGYSEKSKVKFQVRKNRTKKSGSHTTTVEGR